MREALALAIPTEQLLDTVYFGTAEAANSVLPQGKYWSRDVPAIPYDVDRAKALLAEAGADRGFDLRIDVVGGDTVAKQIATILQQQWADLGIRLEIVQKDAASVVEDRQKGDYDLSFITKETSDIPVEDELHEGVFARASGLDGGFTGYHDQTADDLVTRAASSLDEAERQRLFTELQRIGLRDLPFLPVAFVRSVTAVRDDVENFHTLLTGWWRLEQVWKRGDS